MIVLCSGEGPSDIGKKEYDLPSGKDKFKPGVIGSLLIYMLKHCLENDFTINFVKKSELKSHKNDAPRMTLPSLYRGKGSGYFFKEASIFGKIAQDRAASNNDTVIAVLFRDSDPTNVTYNYISEEKFDSIIRGFKYFSFNNGIPMTPKPTSEAWALAGILASPYQDNPEKFEDEVDRDKLKDIVSENNAAFSNLCCVIENEENCSLVNENMFLNTCEPFYKNLLVMPSFLMFEEKFCEVLKSNIRNNLCYNACHHNR